MGNNIETLKTFHMLQNVRLTSLLNTQKEKVSTSLFWKDYNTDKSFPHLFVPSKSAHMSLLSLFKIHSIIASFLKSIVDLCDFF